MIQQAHEGSEVKKMKAFEVIEAKEGKVIVEYRDITEGSGEGSYSWHVIVESRRNEIIEMEAEDEAHAWELAKSLKKAYIR